MRYTVAISLLLALASSLAGCDPIWVRQSFVEVAPESFPSCVASALNQAGLKATLLTDSDGKKRLAALYLTGALNVTAKNSSSTHRQVVELRLIGRGYRPSNEIEPKLGEGMGNVTVAIAKSCANG